MSLTCAPPPPCMVREGSRITQNTPQQNETAFATELFSVHVSIWIRTWCHGISGRRPSRGRVQRSSGNAADAIISSHQVAWQRVWKVGLLTHETETRRTAYIPQEFKTKPRRQTALEESSVLDDVIRQSVYCLKDFHDEKIKLKCTVSVYSDKMFTGNGS